MPHSPEEPVAAPFTVLIDSAESHPFTFEGIRADADRQHRPIVVPRRHECLGRHPHSLGDYSAEATGGGLSLVGVAHVERKSLDDVQGTVLGWETPSERARELAGRRDRFEKELSNLEKIRWPLVVVEATRERCLELMPSYGKKTREVNAKVFFRSVQAYRMDYRVQWDFCESRRMAEVVTYRHLERAWKKLNREHAQKIKEQKQESSAAQA